MKSTVSKGEILSVILFIIASVGANAQQYLTDPKYGKDSTERLECVKNSSLYAEYVKQDNFKDAFPFWSIVYNICPQSSRNIYINGVKIFKDFVEKEVDPVKKNIYFDSLMNVYDKRIAYFGQKGFVLGRKGVDYLRYKYENAEDVENGYKILEESINLREERPEEAVLVTFMTATETLYKAAKIDGPKVIENYALMVDMLQEVLDKNPNDDKAPQALDVINEIFERTGVGTCEELIALFKPKFELTPDDIKLLDRITSLLDKKGCQDEDLYFKASEKLYTLRPDAKSAAMVAGLAQKRNEFAKAVKYLEEAVSLEGNNETKAAYYLQIADIYRKQDKFTESRDYARKAISANPSSGQPYITIGHLYAASGNLCETEECDKGTVYWIAVDMYQKAKSIEPALADEANKYINTYSGYFPTKENLFFCGEKTGDKHYIGCWIDETTTVRTNE